MPPASSTSRGRVWLVLLVAGLLVPQCLTGLPRESWIPELGRPLICSGDEPHYLVIIHSFLEDGDFDLANNYANVNAGGIQAGRWQRHWRTLDHHTQFFVGKRSLI